MNGEKILEKSRENFEYMKKIRRDIHKCPGVGFDNRETMEYIRTELSVLGVPFENVGKCGLLAYVGKGEKSFLLRADTDGLKMKEETGLPFASANGNFHGCGHDMHTAMLLGAVKLLKENGEEIDGKIYFMFQSAEEILEGAKDMIAAGVLERSKPKGAAMLHVLTGLPVKSGTVIVPNPGVGAPGADFFEITVHGKGCHGSSPATGKDPLYTGAFIVTALSEINSRELSAGESVPLTIGSFRAGDAANVIPDTAHLRGTLRSFDENTRKRVKKRFCEISQGIAKTFRCTAEVNFTSGCPSLLNDERLCNNALLHLPEVMGENSVLSAKSFGTGGTLGSEDFAYISRQVPSLMLALAAGEPAKGYKYPLHHPMADFDESVLPAGSAALVYTALCQLEN